MARGPASPLISVSNIKRIARDTDWHGKEKEHLDFSFLKCRKDSTFLDFVSWETFPNRNSA